MYKKKEGIKLSKIKIFALGGLNEDGKNMYVVKVDEDIFVFDAGLKYPKDIQAEYVESSHYWYRYPGLYEGAYPISESVLDHEVMKYTLLDNSHGFEVHGWKPEVSFKEGLERTVDYSIKVLKNAQS